MEFKGLKIERLRNDHISGVKVLFNKYLIPTYYKRLGIRQGDEGDYAYNVESIINTDMLHDDMYKECSLLAIDSNYVVVGCQMSYFVDKKCFQRTFIDDYRVLMNNDGLLKGLQRYAQQTYEIWQGLDIIFDKYHLKKVFYLETSIVEPEYRHNGLSAFFINHSKDSWAGKCDAVLYDSLIPQDVYLRTRDKMMKRPHPLLNSISLRRVTTYDKFYVDVALYLYDKEKVSKL